MIATGSAAGVIRAARLWRAAAAGGAAPDAGAAAVGGARVRRGCASRRTCRRETTSSSTTASRSACATASRSTRTSIGPSGDGRHPVIVSSTPYSTERFPTAYDAAVYFAQRGYVYVFQDVRGTPRVGGRWEPVLRRREGRLRHDRVGREAAVVERQGRHAGRLVPGTEPVAGRAGRTRPAWSPSSRWSPRPASTTTGSRSTAAGGCRSTSAGGRCARNRGSCRTPGRTRSTGCARSTTTRCSGICP